MQNPFVLFSGMFFHKVPENHYPLKVPVIERVSMTILPMTVNNLLPLITPTPLTAGPGMNSIHVCWVRLWLLVTVHCGHDGFQMVHLYMIIPTISCFYSSIWTSTQITGSVRGVWNSFVIDSMHVYY